MRPMLSPSNLSQFTVKRTVTNPKGWVHAYCMPPSQSVMTLLEIENTGIHERETRLLHASVTKCDDIAGNRKHRYS